MAAAEAVKVVWGLAGSQLRGPGGQAVEQPTAGEGRGGKGREREGRGRVGRGGTQQEQQRIKSFTACENRERGCRSEPELREDPKSQQQHEALSLEPSLSFPPCPGPSVFTPTQLIL